MTTDLRVPFGFLLGVVVSLACYVGADVVAQVMAWRAARS